MNGKTCSLGNAKGGALTKVVMTASNGPSLG